jgi:hypothetical protein
LPDVSLPQQPVARDLVAITRNLVDEERRGARMMRDLAQRERASTPDWTACYSK